MALREYWVTVFITDAEAESLDGATGIEYDDRVAGVIREEPSEGFALVAFQIRAYDSDDPMGAAYREAMAAYTRLRRNAELDGEGTPSMITTVHLRDMPDMPAAALKTLPPPRATRRAASLPHEKLLLKARNLHASKHGHGQYDAATVVAHAACEVAITAAMGRLIAVHAAGLQPALEGLIGNSRYSLTDERVAGLWDALAHDKIRQATFWFPYVQHLKRRNGIVHAGKSVSRDQAEQSIEIAQDICDHVTGRST